MLIETVRPDSCILHRKLKDEEELFSGVYIEIEGKDLEMNLYGVAEEATVEVGVSPTLTKSVEIRAKVGDRLIAICLTHEIVEMIEKALCRK